LQPDFGALALTFPDQQADRSHTVSVADVSLISELDTSHLLQSAEVDVVTFRILILIRLQCQHSELTAVHRFPARTTILNSNTVHQN